MPYLNSQQHSLIEKLLNEKFYFFCQSIMPPEWYDEKCHRELCDFLQYGGIRKLVILPRTFLKTTIAATLYPLWKASKNSDLRVLETSNTSPNAEKTVRAIRTIVETNKLYQAFFPHCIPMFNKVRWSDRCACLNRKEDYPEGTFESAGVGANIIRRHFNVIIEDDTVAPKKDELTGEEAMPSKDDIEQAIGFHKLTTPLLINEDDENLVILTRWASYDLANYIMENEKYAVFDRPAIDENNRPLYKRFSAERLDAIRLVMGTQMFSSLYLNKPLAKEYMIFKPEWIKYYEENELPEEGDGIVTVDPADPPTGKSSQDYTAIVSCKHTKRGLYVRRYVRARLSDNQLIEEALNVAESDGAYKIRVEVDRYAHLQFAFREAMTRRKKWYVMDAVKTKGKVKEARIRQRLSPMFENGVIHLKKGMRELEEELFTFPNGKHDDVIDALAWQIEGVYPTEVEVPKAVQKRMLPTFGEMLDTIYKRNRTSRYPFDKQLNPENAGLLGRPM